MQRRTWRGPAVVLVLFSVSACQAGASSTSGPAAAPQTGSTVHSGVLVSVTTAEPTTRPGQRVDFTVVLATRTDAAAAWTAIDWGDGTPIRQNYWSQSPCVPIPGSTLPRTRTPIPSVLATPRRQRPELAQHYYRQAGRYLMTVTAGALPGCPGDAPGTGQVEVLVAGPAAPGNGPADPWPQVSLVGYSEGVLAGDLTAFDRDGYLSRVTVTWPDGSVVSTMNPTPCTDPGRAWSRSDLGVPFRRRLPPGSYTVTLTALSSDCGGGARQQITVVRRFELTAAGVVNPSVANSYQPHAPVPGYSEGAITSWE